MTAPDLISYRHKDDHQNKTRFVQSRNEQVPIWADDVQPCVSQAHPLAAEARMALERDDVAGWIGSLPKTPLADALAAALREANQIMLQCTFETIRVKGQYLDREEVVARNATALAAWEARK